MLSLPEFQKLNIRPLANPPVLKPKSQGNNYRPAIAIHPRSVGTVILIPQIQGRKL